MMNTKCRIAALGFCCALLVAFSWQAPKISVYLVGDSTCAIKDTDAYPETGWGMPFVYFFDESVKVENHARNGRSTKSFMEEGLWKNVMQTLVKDDYVFIQFGHNDEVPSKVGRYTTPDEFQTNLRKYISDTRSKGANPVLLTPVARRSFDESGNIIDTHDQYAELVRQVAASENVPLIDMTQKSMGLLQEMGMEKSQLLYHHLKPGEHPNYPKGKEDDTHFNELGARKMAQLVLEGIRELDLKIEEHIVKGTR